VTGARGFCLADRRRIDELSRSGDLTGLGADDVVELTGELAVLDPATELACLSAILSGDSTGTARSAQSPTAAIDLRIWRVDPELLLALQGADADPEMEWEDAVLLWKTSAASASANCDDTELLALIDRLRLLAGRTTDALAFYCWWSDHVPVLTRSKAAINPEHPLHEGRHV
jgi:hypothetical protein